MKYIIDEEVEMHKDVSNVPYGELQTFSNVIMLFINNHAENFV